MTDPRIQREHTSIKQLTAVSMARQIRLKADRKVLAERERVLDRAWDAQRLDEELLAEQRARWRKAWQDWARAGGALRQAAALRGDKELLADMEALAARRRAELHRTAERLAEDLRAWGQRWRAGQEFEASLGERARTLRISVERASERQRDEEALTALTAAGAMGKTASSMRGTDRHGF